MNDLDYFSQGGWANKRKHEWDKKCICRSSLTPNPIDWPTHYQSSMANWVTSLPSTWQAKSLLACAVLGHIQFWLRQTEDSVYWDRRVRIQIPCWDISCFWILGWPPWGDRAHSGPKSAVGFSVRLLWVMSHSWPLGVTSMTTVEAVLYPKHSSL